MVDTDEQRLIGLNRCDAVRYGSAQAMLRMNEVAKRAQCHRMVQASIQIEQRMEQFRMKARRSSWQCLRLLPYICRRRRGERASACVQREQQGGHPIAAIRLQLLPGHRLCCPADHPARGSV